MMLWLMGGRSGWGLVGFVGVIYDRESRGLVEEEDGPVLVAVVRAIGEHEICQDTMVNVSVWTGSSCKEREREGQTARLFRLERGTGA